MAQTGTGAARSHVMWFDRNGKPSGAVGAPGIFGNRMKDIHEVLRTKELEMENLRIEIEALRITAPLLSDDGDDNGAAPVSTRWVAPTRPFQVPQAANSDPQPEHAPEWKKRIAGFP